MIKGTFVKIVNIYKQKHQNNKRVLRQDHGFSTRLPYANEKIRELNYSLVFTIYNTAQEMINNLQSLKGKKLKLHEKKN